MVYLWKPFHKCFAKVRRNWSANDSVIHAYTTVFFLSSVCLTYTSFQLLDTTYVYNINGTSVRKVLVHEPTIESFSPQHLPYAIPAMLLPFFLGVCPTIFLCLYPIGVFRKCFYRCITPRFQLSVNFFIETFQNCYKDGLNGTYDFRFLSSVPFFLFLTFVLLSTIPGTTKFNSHIYLAGCISLVFIILGIIINPRRACAARVTVVVLCVCVCATILGLQATRRLMGDTNSFIATRGKKNNVAILLKRLRS